MLAYCAGLFDGEGCIILYASDHKGSAKYRYIRGQATVEIREELIVDIFVATFGGMKRYKSRRSNNHSDIYVWKVTGKALRKFLELMDGYLILKARQADTMRSFLNIREGRSTHSITEQEYEEMVRHMDCMRVLNRKGVGK